jgi:hypothetical protein
MYLISFCKSYLKSEYFRIDEIQLELNLFQIKEEFNDYLKILFNYKNNAPLERNYKLNI